MRIRGTAIGLFVFAFSLSCGGCSQQSDPIQRVKHLTMPPDAALVRNDRETQDGLSRRFAWDFRTSMPSSSYERWVADRFRSEGFLQTAAWRFRKSGGGETYGVELVAEVTQSGLLVAVAVVVYPD